MAADEPGGLSTAGLSLLREYIPPLPKTELLRSALVRQPGRLQFEPVGSACPPRGEVAFVVASLVRSDTYELSP